MDIVHGSCYMSGIDCSILMISFLVPTVCEFRSCSPCNIIIMHNSTTAGPCSVASYRLVINRGQQAFNPVRHPRVFSETLVTELSGTLIETRSAGRANGPKCPQNIVAFYLLQLVLSNLCLEIRMENCFSYSPCLFYDDSYVRSGSGFMEAAFSVCAPPAYYKLTDFAMQRTNRSATVFQ